MAYNITLPGNNTPFVDLKTGQVSTAWYQVLYFLLGRTGGQQGLETSSAISTATNAQSLATVAQVTSNQGVTAAGVAQTTANTAVASAATAQSTASSGLALATYLNGAAVLKTNFQSDGIAPLASPTFTGTVALPVTIIAPLLPQASDDANAGALGIVVGQFYANGNIVQQRQL